MGFDELNRVFGIEGTVEERELIEGVDYIPCEVGTSCTTPCTYKGIDFPSMTAAAEHFGVTVGAVSLYVKREGCYRYELPVSYKGKTYKNIAEAAKCSGDKYQSVVNWINRHNSHLA